MIAVVHWGRENMTSKMKTTSNMKTTTKMKTTSKIKTTSKMKKYEKLRRHHTKDHLPMTAFSNCHLYTDYNPYIFIRGALRTT